MLLPLLPIDEVQIVPFPAFNNLQPLMPEEIPFGDLLGFVNEPQHDQKMHDQLLWVLCRCQIYSWIPSFMKGSSQPLFQSLLQKPSDSG